MSTEKLSLAAEGIVATNRPTTCGIENESADERIENAVNAIEAINGVINNNLDGEHPGFWSDLFIDHLHEGIEVLTHAIRKDVAVLRDEASALHTRLGDYGESRAGPT